MAKKVKKTLSVSVETSGRAGSVAVGFDGEKPIETRFTGQLRHSIELFSAIKKLLESKGQSPMDVARIYCVIGPGSFTGLRISVTMAKMFSLATGASIIGVNTMDALAENASDYQDDTGAQVSKIATLIDAKRGQFFTAVFERKNDQWAKTTEDKLITSDEFVAEFANGDPIHLLGEGLVYYKKDFVGEGVHFLPENYWTARANNVFRVGEQKAELGEFSDAKSLVPYYLRGTGAKPKKGLKP